MSNNINSFSENMRKTIALQTNTLALLTAMQLALSTNDTFVSYNFEDTNGNTTKYELPSYVSMNNRVEALEESINTLAKGKGSISLDDGSRRTISMSPIPKTPSLITGLSDPSTFTIDSNWFFEDFMFPGATVEVDLTGQIEDTADRVKVIRVILNSNEAAAQDIWANNLSLNSYDYVSLISLLSDAGVVYREDEEVVNLPIVANTESGTFQITEDPEVINGNIWYKLDNLKYSSISNDGVDQGKNNILSQGDLISYSDSIFEIVEINQNNNKVRIKRTAGAATPGIYSIFNFYQDPFRDKTINVRFGAHEYDIIYMKGINEDYNLQADSWSTPIKFASDELYYKTTAGAITDLNFYTYYLNNIADWGADMIADAKEHNIKAYYGHTPNAPTLNADDLRVVQINTQVNAAIDTTTVKNNASEIESVKSQINSLKQTIASLKTDLLNITNLYSYNSMQELIATNTTNLKNLQNQYSTLVNDFQTLIKENGALATDPKYHIRGFFPIPAYQYYNEENEILEEIIGFDISYRYIQEDNTATALNTFTYTDTDGQTTVTGTFSDWNLVHSEKKLKEYDNDLLKYVWEQENVGDGTEININQIDIPIQKGERVEIKVRSISEAGYPSNCLRSPWSDSIIITFPDNLPTTNQIASLITEVNDDALQITVNNILDSNGITAHVADSVPNTNSVNGMYYYHPASSVAFENKDESNNTVSTVSVQDKLTAVNARFNNAVFYTDLANINYLNYDISIEES